MLQSKADKLVAAIEGAGGDEMRNQKALVDQLQKVRSGTHLLSIGLA